MTDPLQKILAPLPVAATLFPATSRYSAIDIAVYQTPDGQPLAYLRRRFVPAPERFALLQLHTVVQGDRLDNLAAKYLDDPEQFWRLCDANGAVLPEALIKVIGRKLRITLPEGIPGGGDA